MRFTARPTAVVAGVGSAVAVFGDRHGGVSVAPFASRNVGDHVGDDPDAVAENRRRFAAAALGVGAGAVEPRTWTWLAQVHGAAVHTAEEAPHAGAPVPCADAAVTSRRGHVVAVVTADCAPIALLTDETVGIVHAGHRGLLAGVVERAVQEVRAQTAAPITAVIGPCIHPDRYEFGVDDLAPFVARFGVGVAAVTADGRPALDLRAGVRGALRDVGVAAIDDVGICTAASSDHFSHRRDGVTGRQASIAMVRP
ncbi:MAG TPA: polyphenol oxidase family protein [Acidimicrobiia bacterium]|nr:polyphenol oxidase family protein [Acidimicrobiia bacterium]